MTTSFIYVRKPGTRTPVGCIAYKTSKVKDKEVVKFAYSTCHNTDIEKFSKVLARDVALKRLDDSEKTSEVEVPETSNRHTIVRKILDTIKSSGVKEVKVKAEPGVAGFDTKIVPEFPSTLRKFSKFWLKSNPLGKKNKKKSKSKAKVKAKKDNV